MRKILIILVALFAAESAAAKNITSEAQYYKDISIRFSDNADVCGFTDPKPYEDYVKERLSGMDLPHNPDGIVDIVVTITASAGGFLNQDCIAYTQLRMQANFESSFLDANAYSGDDQTFMILSQRSYEFPMVFYQTGAVYTEYAQSMQQKTISILGELLDNLDKARAER